MDGKENMHYSKICSLQRLYVVLPFEEGKVRFYRKEPCVCIKAIDRAASVPSMWITQKSVLRCLLLSSQESIIL
jgi:hypothetical protein